MTTDAKIGEKVRALREQRGFPQAHIALVMNAKGHRTWNQSTVARIEQGARSLRLTEAASLCGDALLGCSLDDLVAD